MGCCFGYELKTVSGGRRSAPCPAGTAVGMSFRTGDIMKKKTLSKRFYIGLTAIVLAFLVVVTAVVVINIAVSVTGSRQPDMVLNITGGNAGTLAAASAQDNESVELLQNAFSVYDEDQVWTTNTKINLFEHSDPHVKSDGTGNAENVIAPGTSNEYVFTLKNEKDKLLRYAMRLYGDNDSEYKIPVKIRLVDLSSDGNVSKYSDIDDLMLERVGTIDAGGERSYRIDWEWEYENGTDKYDTKLGNLAVDEEIPCHVTLMIAAAQDIAPPPTSSTPVSPDPTISTPTSSTPTSSTPASSTPTSSTPASSVTQSSGTESSDTESRYIVDSSAEETTSSASDSSYVSQTGEDVYTGDRTNVTLIFVFMLTGACALIVVLATRRRKDDV